MLLDMGGVLLDVGNAEGIPVGKQDYRGREALLALLREAGARLDFDDLERLVFTPWRAEHALRYERGREASWKPHLARLRKASGTRLRDLQLLAAWFGPYAETVTPNPAARPVLARLAALGVARALVSNVPLPGRLYERLLARHGLLGFLPVRVWSYDSGSRKPSPAMLREALARLAVPAGEAAFVGDRRSNDIAAGKAAGVRTVWLRSEDRAGPAPDLEIADLAELPALLGLGEPSRRIPS